ncbi:hypothetical protein SAMN06273572_102458 [Monaibacterium marinum]|uniref:Uncharacterized protein n=1 Tax=Pontivivens marinum TaxID=1690039 RepID=A0A2C9CRE1_9RHOB|nr:hypothetical protein SAMN06273572_102458 [Monaibacterium marinum]
MQILKCLELIERPCTVTGTLSSITALTISQLAGFTQFG